MPTKKTSNASPRDEIREEYVLDYRRSRPNRFAAKLKDTTVVVLQPDVAEVFQSAEAVNDLLRSAIAATGAGSSKRHHSGSSSKQSSRHAGRSSSP